MKRASPTIFLAFLILAMQPLSAQGEVFRRAGNTIMSLRGDLVDIHYGHRMITIEDEFTKLTRTFHVPWKRIDHLKVGDEVRVYFYPNQRAALSVQKMTPIEYRQKDQNKGYLLRDKTAEDQNFEL